MHITHHQTKLALGSDTTLTIASDMPEDEISDLFRTLWLEIFRFERKFSRFLPNSELARFNRLAGQQTPITPEFRNLLIAAKNMAEYTDGLFNPFILPALQRAGYNRSFVKPYAQDNQESYTNRYVAEPTMLEIGDDWAMIPYGTAIDLGGCGKGYLADLLCTQPGINNLQGYWFSIGGDIRGSGTDTNGKPWRIRIQDASAPHMHLEKEYVGDPSGFAIATSGTIIRRDVNESDKSWHHIIDTRTMKPANSDVLLATVAHESALQADVLASCAVILGSKQSPKFMQDRGVTNTLLQTNTRSALHGIFQQRSGDFLSGIGKINTLRLHLSN